MTPLVSICVPNLNARPFLEERFNTIFDQTFHDWELFVYDSHSDDGSWEFIQQLAKKCERMQIAEGPREGPYPAWNECLRRTTGEYVYIATSDDAMAPDFFERMVSALEANPDCELAHAPLRIVDESGAKVNDRLWPEHTVFADAGPELLNVSHIRRAPYDGLLQLTGRHAFLSITQLLIRRSIFKKVGNFPNKWGSVSDFNWEMKAGLLANTVHVPDTWATWRIHSKQATAGQDFLSAEYQAKIDDMIRDAYQTCEAYLPQEIRACLESRLLKSAEQKRVYYRSLWSRSRISIRLYKIQQICFGSAAVREEILRGLLGKPVWQNNAPVEIRTWLESLGLQPLTACSLPTRKRLLVP
jgi:glycosyltransferase involved in cell wall biosynthesis